MVNSSFEVEELINSLAKFCTVSYPCKVTSEGYSSDFRPSEVVM